MEHSKNLDMVHCKYVAVLPDDGLTYIRLIGDVQLIREYESYYNTLKTSRRVAVFRVGLASCFADCPITVVGKPVAYIPKIGLLAT